MRALLHEKYQLDIQNIAIAQPPSIAMGEYALPLAMELAKKLRKPPRKIAEEIIAALGELPGFEKFEIAGAGYINARVKRADFAAQLLKSPPQRHRDTEKVLVEHTSINPNKAAHVGHLRNAILGDSFVRLLRAHGAQVAVQNYIDNTGVQVADVVVGFMHLEKKSEAEIRALAAQPRFDYICWDVYARASQWYEQDKKNLEKRSETLHAIEQGGNPTAAMAELISVAVLRRHLETMQRLEVEYDFLPRESEILHLHFWDAAFELLKARGELRLETQGKNAGCWVMLRGASKDLTTKDTKENTKDTHSTSPQEPARSGQAAEAVHAEEDPKVIVRSNGTGTHLGKE